MGLTHSREKPRVTIRSTTCTYNSNAKKMKCNTVNIRNKKKLKNKAKEFILFE